MTITLDDYYEQTYPEHSRTSCSDQYPINADVQGHGCRRCNAIVFHREAVATEALRRVIQHESHGAQIAAQALTEMGYKP